MEAVPRLPMLSFELKISPVCPDFAIPFKQFISKYYGEDGDLYDREIIELENLRNSACRATRDVTGVSILKRYYCQINSLYNRFSAMQHQIGVQCAWADIYTGQTTLGDLDFELACILYNIGALHGELGAQDPRQTVDEMKICCAHFQCAAWAFKHLSEEKKFCRSNDLSNDVLNFMVQIMLAQAQECILEKSMLDNRKPSIVSKVTAQVVEFYKSAMNMLQQGAMNTSSQSSIVEIVGSKLFKHWKKYVEFKVAYYDSITALYMGNASEEQQKMGERVAWYELADTRIKTAATLAKQLDETSTAISDALVFVSDVITVKLSNAKKENDFIYHEKIPAPAALPEVKGAPLVKGIPFNVCDPEVSGPDIFSRLVPIEAHETASIYSARKDEIMRKTRMKIEEKNQELVAFVSSLQVEKDRLRAPREDPIPDELVDACAELSLHPEAIDEVENTLNKLDTISEETGKIIAESKKLLTEEEEKENEHQKKFGKRPPSLIVVELSKELSKHEETHKKAVESNRSLRENFEQHKEDIMVMTSSNAASKIAAILPSNSNIKVDEKVVSEMERLFDKIEEMKTQRITLLEQLTTAMDKDNVMKLVLAHPRDQVEKMFDEEIKKYDKIVDLIDKNLAAQANILKAMTECNAGYSETRKEVIEVQRNRRTRIASLLYTYQVFKELQVNSLKGLEFYQKFQTIITRLNARIRGVMKVQDEERAQFVQAQANRILMAQGGGGSIMMGTMPPFPGPAISPELSLPSMPVAPIPATGAKLKDYLPYMTMNRSNKGTASSAINAASMMAGIKPSLTPTPPSIPPTPPSGVQQPPQHFQQPVQFPQQNPAISGHIQAKVAPVGPIQQQQYPSPPPYSNVPNVPNASNHYSIPTSMIGSEASLVVTVSPSVAYPPPPTAPQNGYRQLPISSVLPIQPATGGSTNTPPPNLPYPMNQPHHPMPNSVGNSIPPYPVSQPQHPAPQSTFSGGQFPQMSTTGGYRPTFPAGTAQQQPPYSFIMSSTTSNPPATGTAPFKPLQALPTPYPQPVAPQSTVPAPAVYQQPHQQPVAPQSTVAYSTGYGGGQYVSPTVSTQANTYPTTYPMTSQSYPQNNVQPPSTIPTSQQQRQQYYHQPQQQNNTPPKYSNPQPQPYPGTPYPTAGSQAVTYPMPNPTVVNGHHQHPQQQHGMPTAIPHPTQPCTTPAASATETITDKFERESKTGWPVLTPTPASSTGAMNGGAKPAAPSTDPAATSGDSQKLPDILSTMSINGQTIVTATNINIIPEGKTNGQQPPVPLQPKTMDNSGKLTDDGESQKQQPVAAPAAEEPTDLLSQFDPLFT